MHEVLVNRFGGLSLPRKSVVRLTDRPNMTLDVYRGRKTTIQYNNSLCDGQYAVRGAVLYMDRSCCIFQFSLVISNLQNNLNTI